MGNLYHPLLTLRAIDAAIEADQGASYRGWLRKVLPHMNDAYRDEKEDGHRAHLGASILGNECARAIYYSYRWVTRASFSGRMLRLFNRGHLEEGRVIAALLMIGVQVFQQDENGKQFRISWAEGHAGGSGDGLATNVPDVPNIPVVLEFKTHGEKSFIELAGKLPEWRAYVEGTRSDFTGKGVKEAKPEHYVQMQTYMRKMGLTCSLYAAVNKNTDDIYMELVYLVSETADAYIDRGDRLVWLEKAPARLSESPGFFKCRFCDHYPVCHTKATPDLNCRTCQFSKPIPDNGQWWCNKHAMVLPVQKQLLGCPDWYQNDGF